MLVRRVDETAFQNLKAALGLAFKALRKRGLIALQNFECCQGCALYSIDARFQEARKTGKKVTKGYVFYHHQDTDSIYNGGQVHLAFGVHEEGNGAPADIGRLVVEELGRQPGVVVEWDGSPDRRILVRGLKYGETKGVQNVVPQVQEGVK